MNATAPLRAAVVLLALLIAGCASTPSVDVQRNPEVDLGAMRTFGWMNPLGTDREGYESFVTARLKRDVRAALEARGLRYDEGAPALRVNFYANIEEKQEVVRMPATGMTGTYIPGSLGYYGFRSGLYNPFPSYENEIREFQEGTLTIDLVDAASKQLAWSGNVHGRVTRKALEDPETTTRNAVELVLAEFP